MGRRWVESARQSKRRRGGAQNAVSGCKIHEMDNAGPEGAGEKIGEA